ncbi:hypothetical protein [Paraburkholderia lacunae]|uniref:Uncharacterized protein n=1 Tax=Paraburkholderia lacunae TaxID=2211104 RepID=A0A370MWR8_9BURK|nr:hypothetical protein [Paraburkholderia lacunae]RDJ97805.1 hypothetical protein DLM46_36000 [Paraburkholderia lacunae]
MLAARLHGCVERVSGSRAAQRERRGRHAVALDRLPLHVGILRNAIAKRFQLLISRFPELRSTDDRCTRRPSKSSSLIFDLFSLRKTVCPLRVFET